MHDQDCGLDVHDVVLLGVEEQPVVEQGELGVAHRNLDKKNILNSNSYEIKNAISIRFRGVKLRLRIRRPNFN